MSSSVVPLSPPTEPPPAPPADQMPPSTASGAWGGGGGEQKTIAAADDDREIETDTGPSEGKKRKGTLIGSAVSKAGSVAGSALSAITRRIPSGGKGGGRVRTGGNTRASDDGDGDGGHQLAGEEKGSDEGGHHTTARHVVSRRFASSKWDAEVEKRLGVVAAEGSRSQAQLRVPTIYGGGLLYVSSFVAIGIGLIGILVDVTGEDQWTLFQALFAGCCGLVPSTVLVLLAVTPNESFMIRWFPWVVMAVGGGGCVMFLGGAVVLAVMATPLEAGANATALEGNATIVLPGGQCGSLPALWFPCENVVPICSFFAFLSLGAGTFFTRIASSIYNRVPARAVLETLWVSIGWFWVTYFVIFLLFFAILTATGIDNFLVTKYPISSPKASPWLIWLMIEMVVVGTAALRPSFRMHAQAWFVSRNDSTSRAASVAALIGGEGSQATLGKAQKMFRCISLDVLTRRDMASNKPDPALYERSTVASLGSVDAFVSHSWRDEASAKWAALQMWRNDFKDEHGREPRVWIDKCCKWPPIHGRHRRAPAHTCALFQCLPCDLSASF